MRLHRHQGLWAARLARHVLAPKPQPRPSRRMSTTLACLVDTRERDLIPLLSPWPTRTLPVGDIWIGVSGEDAAAGEPAKGGLIIERKATDDLEASILDGRYREQRTRLTAYAQQRGARPLYIIEGPMDRMWGRLSKDALQKHLNRLMLRYGVPVLHTESLAETAEACQLLAAQISEDPAAFAAADPAAVAYTSTLSIQKRGNREDPRNFASAALQGCPGVSAAVAEALLTAFGGTLRGVLAAEETAIAAVKVTEKRRVGPALAKRLCGILRAE
jgi:ERCC4-type nuclease